MKYDDAEYLFLNFETDLDNNAAGTHLGMYLAWSVLRGLGGSSFEDDGARGLVDRLKAQLITGATLLWDCCDGKLMSDDFNEIGNAFTAAYFEKFYVRDYERVFQKDFPDTGHQTDDFCSIPDTWANFERMAAVLDQRFAQWRKPPAPTVPVASATVASASAPKLDLVPMEDAPDARPGERPSLEVLRQRAEAGDREAWFDLAAEYITGERVARDFAQAANALTKAAKMGQIDAQFNLGVCYQNGDGVTKSAGQALHWFSQAAAGGHAEGLYMLGMAYRAGSGVPQDLGASNALLLLARAKGSSNAAGAGIMAGSGGYVDLLKQISEPGKLLETLAARHRTNSDEHAASTAPISTVSPVRSSASATRRVPVVQPGDSSDTRGSDIIGVAATALGAASVFILLFMAGSITGTPLKSAALVFAALGAFGTWRLSTGMGHGPIRRLVLTLCAAVPVAGSFLCMLMLKWRFLG